MTRNSEGQAGSVQRGVSTQARATGHMQGCGRRAAPGAARDNTTGWTVTVVSDPLWAPSSAAVLSEDRPDVNSQRFLQVLITVSGAVTSKRKIRTHEDSRNEECVAGPCSE